MLRYLLYWREIKHGEEKQIFLVKSWPNFVHNAENSFNVNINESNRLFNFRPRLSKVCFLPYKVSEWSFFKNCRSLSNSSFSRFLWNSVIRKLMIHILENINSKNQSKSRTLLLQVNFFDRILANFQTFLMVKLLTLNFQGF